MFGVTFGLFYYLIRLIILSPVTTAQNSTSVIPLSLAPHTGYYCYVRCLAKCIDEHKVSNLENDSCSDNCDAYHSDRLCDSADSACWSRCKDLTKETGESPNTPGGLSVAYTTLPHATPHEADLKWRAVPNATLYIVQYLDKTEASQQWTGDSGNVTTSSVWHFRKPALCSEYAFRVAAVNLFGASSFSRSVDLPVPQPVFENPGYNVTLIELLDKPFHGFAADDTSYNSTIRIVVDYTPPSSWDLATEIIRVEPSFHLAESPLETGQPVAPYIRQIPGEPQFEVLLPGDFALTDKPTKALFMVDRLYTKCSPGRSVEYPNDKLDGVFFIGFSCATVLGASCPGAPAVRPYCNFDSVIPIFDCVNGSFVDVTVTFSKPDKNRTILYYATVYGPDVRPPGGSPVPVLLPWQNETHGAISSEATSFHIPELLPLNRDYAISICAVFDNRSQSIDWNVTSRYPIDLSDPKKNTCGRRKAASSTFILIALPLALVLLVAFTIVTVLYMRTRRRHTKTLAELDKQRNADGTENGYVDMPRLYDRWEIPRSHLTIYDDQKLGSGAFGAVYKGKIRGRALMNKHAQSVLAEEWMKAEDCDVAVKMLPEYADEGAKSEFRKEINLMKQLGHHERLVNMVCCITADEPLCLVVEYCTDGDLLHYLRDRCKYMVKLQEQGVDLANLPEDHDVDLDYILTIKDLLMFSWQICVGLEYLSMKNYIHRDVAARNVMVDAGKRAKIGDFGLCRYSCSDPIYMGKGGRLPWKWMALEAIKNYEFTTKSDVWSCGVLLFEIVTLGGSPYPGVDPGTMEKYLEDGNRLAQPDNCPDDFFAVMTDCWNAFPEKRPTFSELRERLSKQLEVITEDYSYLQLNQSRDYYNMMNQQYNSKPQYPGSLAPISPDDDFFEQSSGESVIHGANVASTSFVNRAFATDFVAQRTPDFGKHTAVTKSSSYPAGGSSDARKTSGDSGIPSDSTSVASMEDNGHAVSVGVLLCRDSAGSDQMLISSGNAPGTPKRSAGSRSNKFFKLRPTQTAERLDTLPESTSSIGGGTPSRKESVETAAVNLVHAEHLLIPGLATDNRQNASSVPTVSPTEATSAT